MSNRTEDANEQAAGGNGSQSEENAPSSANVTDVRKTSEVSDKLYGERTAYEVAVEKESRFGSSRNRNIVIVAVAAVALVSLVLVYALFLRGGKDSTAVNVKTEAGHEDGEHGAEEGEEVKLTPEALAAAGIEIEGVTERPAVSLLRVTGSVETNQQQTQQATPLVSGRVERVNVVLGDTVRVGAVLAVISSPQIAQLHGKLHEAETTLALAERNLQRVQRAENRVAVLSAKAKLDETEATLKRTRRLIDLGAGAGKDLIAAEAAYKTAKAEYDFQSNISLNKEVQEARAAVETARVDVAHIRDEMRSLGVYIPEGKPHDHRRNSSFVALLAPVSGNVTERLVNAGAGVEAGTPMFTIANISTVWVIANVPEAQLGMLRPGTPAEVRSAALGSGALVGRVNYIDPRLNEETRTGKVRIELTNSGGKLKAGMFVEVGFQAGTGTAEGSELVIRDEAVQRIGERTVVFIRKETEENSFEVREVQIGSMRDGYARVVAGLKLGEKVVTKGSFVLKTQMMKGEIGEDDH